MEIHAQHTLPLNKAHHMCTSVISLQLILATLCPPSILAVSPLRTIMSGNLESRSIRLEGGLLRFTSVSVLWYSHFIYSHLQKEYLGSF